MEGGSNGAMKLVEFHIANSGDVIAVNPDSVCRIGKGVNEGTTFIRQEDGSSVDVSEDYESVKKALSD
jgi:hypothetical protein